MPKRQTIRLPDNASVGSFGVVRAKKTSENGGRTPAPALRGDRVGGAESYLNSMYCVEVQARQPNGRRREHREVIYAFNTSLTNRMNRRNRIVPTVSEPPGHAT